MHALRLCKFHSNRAAGGCGTGIAIFNMHSHAGKLLLYSIAAPISGSMARKPVIKLDADFDFLLIGIVTPMKDYRICWFLNNILHLSLARTTDLVISRPGTQKQMSFSRYIFCDELSRSEFVMMENSHEADCVLPEVKEIDYLLIIKGSYYTKKKNDIVKKIKKINEVQTALLIDVNTVKSKENLIMPDIEMAGGKQ